jgi:putative DNA primase/helicase
MMQFLGARMVISSEITQGQKMDTGKLKRTTGGDAITGRYMGKDYVTFDPTHTLWLMANDRLQVPHDDQGVWRRLRVIPFDFAKKESEQVGGLYERILTAEAPGILARWIAKAGQYLNEGISTPSVVMDAREEYVSEQDTLQVWLDSCTYTGNATAFSSGESLRDPYSAWCKREHVTPLGIKKFTQALNDKGFMSTKKRIRDTPTSDTSREMRGFQGISLLRFATDRVS